MKTLHIPYCPTLADKSIELVNALIDHLGVHGDIDSVNWPKAYPYKPTASVTLAQTEEYLFVKWNVQGKMLKAVHTEDFAHVHEDSCVEFFCQLPGDNHYINFEFNCIGTGTASWRLGRSEDVNQLQAEDLQRIVRYATVGRTPFEEIEGEFTWSLCVGIPIDLLRKYSHEPIAPIADGKRGVTLRGNFYKCADKTATPHFISWNPIGTEKPDFHRPEYFGDICL